MERSSEESQNLLSPLSALVTFPAVVLPAFLPGSPPLAT